MQEYELTEAELNSIIEASKPVPAMYLPGGQPMFGTPQTNANNAWQVVARAHGFIWDSAQPAPGKSNRFILAEPQ